MEIIKSKPINQELEQIKIQLTPMSTPRPIPQFQTKGMTEQKLLDFYLEKCRELYNAKRKLFNLFNSPHEGFGVIKEELDELFDAIKNNDPKPCKRDEALDLMMTALKFIISLELIGDNSKVKNAII